MVAIDWCCKNKNGIRLIEPNENLAKAYTEMAKEALIVMTDVKDKSLRWSISSCYYSMYYSLYSILQKIGIKCEIHSCTLKFMETFLLNLYSSEDLKTIEKAFELRESIQYYADRIISKEDTDLVIKQAPLFLNKSIEILSRLNQDDIGKIRVNVKRFIR